MAAVAEVCQTISAAAGVPLRLVEYLARRLGEAGQLPRGPRGRHAPHFEAIHIARLLAAVMVVADGIDFTGASIALAMTRIEALSQGLILTHILLGELKVIGWNLFSRFWRTPHISKA
jgi:hypothetical protein